MFQIAASYAHHIYLFKPRATDGSNIVSINKSENVSTLSFNIKSSLIAVRYKPASFCVIQRLVGNLILLQVRWYEIGFFQLESFVTSLSWNPDGAYLILPFANPKLFE